MPTDQDVRDHVRRMQSLGSPEAMESAAEAERGLERARLDDLRAAKADTPERSSLEEAYPKHKPKAAAAAPEPEPDPDPESREELLKLRRDALENKARAAGISGTAERDQFPNKESIADALIAKREEG